MVCGLDKYWVSGFGFLRWYGINYRKAFFLLGVRARGFWFLGEVFSQSNLSIFLKFDLGKMVNQLR